MVPRSLKRSQRIEMSMSKGFPGSPLVATRVISAAAAGPASTARMNPMRAPRGRRIELLPSCKRAKNAENRLGDASSGPPAGQASGPTAVRERRSSLANRELLSVRRGGRDAAGPAPRREHPPRPSRPPAAREEPCRGQVALRLAHGGAPLQRGAVLGEGHGPLPLRDASEQVQPLGRSEGPAGGDAELLREGLLSPEVAPALVLGEGLLGVAARLRPAEGAGAGEEPLTRRGVERGGDE